jgi:hypothetical protein
MSNNLIFLIYLSRPAALYISGAPPSFEGIHSFIVQASSELQLITTQLLQQNLITCHSDTPDSDIDTG